MPVYCYLMRGPRVGSPAYTEGESINVTFNQRFGLVAVRNEGVIEQRACWRGSPCTRRLLATRAAEGPRYDIKAFVCPAANLGMIIEMAPAGHAVTSDGSRNPNASSSESLMNTTIGKRVYRFFFHVIGRIVIHSGTLVQDQANGPTEIPTASRISRERWGGRRYEGVMNLQIPIWVHVGPLLRRTNITN